ncbi:NAD(P)-binding protein [Hysterangium stoloniferum]|nr:NAD(P)-binding protein [Hysterangium stoloniferum]
MELLLNKVVAITGSSKGIGRACAHESAKQGARGLVLHYFGDKASTNDVKTLESDITKLYATKVVIVDGDIAQQETSARVVAEGVRAFGRIDVLVSNAGICPFWDFLSMPRDIWDRTRQVNLDGSFYIVQAVANQMKQQEPQGGAIIAISSISALVGGEFQCHYSPTKAGVLSLMQSCAVALGKYGIRCNAILPGTIETDINKEDLTDLSKRKYMEQRTALGRLGAPDDIAGPVVFLASDLAKYVTGSSLLVDGGLFVNLQ